MRALSCSACEAIADNFQTMRDTPPHDHHISCPHHQHELFTLAAIGNIYAYDHQIPAQAAVSKEKSRHVQK